MTKARDLSKLLSTSNGKIAGSNLDVSFENISDTGTEGTKVASGTTAQRGSTTGQWRYNSTTGFFEGRNASAFSTLEPTPTIASVDVSEVDSQAGGNQTIVVTGTNFSSGGTIAFVGSSAQFNASTTTFNNATQVTAVAPKSSFLNAQEPYTVKFSSANGIAGSSATGLINVDTSPTWQTASGQLASIQDNATGTHTTVSATDADGDAVVYSIQSGSIPAGTSLNTSSGAISGDPTDVSSATTSNFTLRATANTKTVDRAFSIITNPTLDGTSSAKAVANIATFNGLGTLSTGSHNIWVTLNGAVTAYQQKVFHDGTDTWYLVSPVFATSGLINDSAFAYNNDANNGAFKAIVHGQSSGHNRKVVSTSGTWNYFTGAGFNVQDLIGTALTITDAAGAVPSGHSNSDVTTLSAGTLASYNTVNYYDHVAGSNLASATVTAMRNIVTQLNPKTAWLTITGDDDGNSLASPSSVNWRSNATIASASSGGTPATGYFKNAAGNNFKTMGGQSSANEHMGVSLLTHNEGLFLDSNSSSPSKIFGGTPAFTGGMASGSGYSLGIMPTQYSGEVGGSSTTFTSPLYSSTIGKLNNRLVLLYK